MCICRSVTYIGAGAFYCKSPDRLSFFSMYSILCKTTIFFFFFIDNIVLTYVSLPTSLVVIGNIAFRDCPSLMKVSIPS